MQTTSDTWKSLAAMDGVYVESKAVVNGVEYTDIEPPVITRALMQNGLEVGNVVSAVCQFELDTSANIPKSAEVQIKTRLVGYANDTPIYSEWLPQGTFYVSKRTNDPRISVQRFECYDALLKTNAVWEPASSVWPQTASSVVAEIVGNIGLQLDSRTTIAQYSIGEPSAGTTMRDVLGIIAQQNGGNWIVTPENKLRLVPIVDLSESESADVIIDVDAVINEYYTGEIKTITGVEFAVEDENDSIIGDDTGAVINLTIPGLIASDVAELLIGKTYRPFSYGTAYYDIAAELGDYIQCEDAVSVIYAETVTLGTGMHGDISAPDLAEIADEYPYVGSSNKTLIAAKAYAVVVADAARDAAIDAAAAELAEAVVDINSDIDDLQSQIDGNITTWFYAVNPTLNNPPANAWTTDAEKNNHLGDLYYNTENGYCWRFMLANGQYSWQRISDTDITAALANAQRAQDTADGKRRVFVVQPTPPYDVGDLWVQGMSGDIMRCSTAKATGAAYSQSDWVRASKYTDDTAVNTLNNALTQQEIFNRLTDNGAAQGLVLYNGQLYINASYIRSGTLVLGGLNNINGTLQILDASGTLVGTITKDGISVGTSTSSATLNNGIMKFVQNGAEVGRIWPGNTSAIGDYMFINGPESSASSTSNRSALNFYSNGNVSLLSGDETVQLSFYRDTGDASLVADGTVNFHSGGGASLYLTDDGNAEIRSDGGAASIILNSDGDINVTGSVSLIGSIDSSLTVNDRLTLNGDLTVNADNNINLTSDYEVAIGDTDAKIVKHSDGTVHMQSSGDASVYVTNGGNVEIRSVNGAAYLKLNADGTIYVNNSANWRSAIGANITGVKGNAESSYRTGNVNLTPANIGAVAKTGDTMTGTLSTSGNLITTGGNVIVQRTGEPEVEVISDTTGVRLLLDNAPSGNHGIWSNGYWNGSAFVSSDNWLIYRTTNGSIHVNGNAATATTATKLYDTNGSNTITATYSGSGISATDWFCMWNSYNIGAVSSTNVANKIRDKASGTWGIDISGTAAGNTVLKSTSINRSTTSNANIQLIAYSTGVPIAFTGQTNNNVRVYAAFGKYNDDYWGAKIFDNASNPVASTTIVGTLYYA